MYSNEPPTHHHLERLRSIANGVEVSVAESVEEAIHYARNADAILGHRYLRQVLPYVTQLKWVQSTAAGVDHLFTTELRSAGPQVTRCPIFAETIAQHAMALALAMLRRIPDAVLAQKRGEWNAPFEMLPTPQTIMIIGMGYIGRAIARLVRPMAPNLIGVERSSSCGEDLCDQILTVNTWRRALPRVDVCFLAIPESPSNRRFFDSEAIDSLPSHSVIVNVGRGSTINQDYLFSALRDGRLGGAALDVLDPIPVNKDDQIWHTPRLLLSPKVALYTPDRQHRLETFIESQVTRFLTAKPLLHEVSIPE